MMTDVTNPLPPRSLPDWLRPPTLAACNRHRLLREFGRWVWQQQEKKTRLPASSHRVSVTPPASPRSPWQFAVAPLWTDPENQIAFRGEDRSGPRRLLLPELQDHLPSKPNEELRCLARSFAYIPLSASDVFCFLNGYLEQVGASSREQRVLIAVEYPWMDRWLVALQKQRLTPMAWPQDCPLPHALQFCMESAGSSGSGDAESVDYFRPDSRLALDLHPDRLPAPDAPGRLDKPGLSPERVRQRRELKLGDKSATGAGPTSPVEAYLKWYQTRDAKLAGLAQHELITLYEANHCGIPAAEPLAAAWTRFPRRTPGFLSVLATRAIPGEALDRWIQAGPQSIPMEGGEERVTEGEPAAPSTPRVDLAPFAELSPQQRHDLARHLGLLLGHLHAAHLYHRDAYLCHFFVSQNPDGRLALRLIDLARALHRPWFPGRWAVKDLAALYYSSLTLASLTRTDRLRVLQHYLLGSNERDFRKKAWRRWVACIQAKAARIARHDRRRG